MGNMKRELEQIAANDVDPDAPRAKRRNEAPAASPDNAADMASAVVKAESGEKAGDGESAESVREQGIQLWQTIKDAVNKEGRVLSLDFMRLPSRRQYPDYYQTIKRPISLDEIKTQLQIGGYQSLEMVKSDLETVFTNAKKYNLKESQIWKDAKALHKMVKKEHARITGTTDEEPPEAGEKGREAGGEGSENEGDKKSKKTPNMTRLLKSRLQKLVEKTDEDGRVLSQEFMELPSKKQWAVYYKTIKRPQCLENIFKHLKRKEYHTSAEFARDVELVFSNAMEFNQDHTPIWEDALLLRDHFRKLMSDLPPPYALPEYAPPKPAPVQSSGKIKLKMPAASHSASAPGPSTASKEHASPTLTLRVPTIAAGQGSPPGQNQNADSTKSASPAMLPIAPAGAPKQISVAPKPSATNVTQPPVATPRAAGPSKLPISPIPSYSVHYPNAMYHQTATPTTPAVASAPAITVTNLSAEQVPEKFSSVTKSPTPPPRSHLKHATLLISPTTRRIDLDPEDGVKSWAMRVTNGERLVTVKDVSLLEEEEQDEKVGEQEAEVTTKDVKGKGRVKGSAKMREATATAADPSKAQVNGKRTKGVEALEVRLNGNLIKSMQGTEWQVDLPVGSSILEIGEPGGVLWKVFFDRPLL